MYEVSIKVEHVNKTFKLPHEKAGSVKGLLTGLGRRQRGFEKQHVLKNVSFEIKKGEFFGIVGRNGSGKSTMLKLLAGIYTPDSGEIHVNGKLTPFIELGVGFNPELTGRDNVYLNGALLGFNHKEMAVMYDDIVKFAELERFMDQKLKNYSSGMQVRLAFSIAIRAKSDILVLDEVLAVGDAAFQKKCFDYFRKLKDESKTVILVSHSMDSIKKFCDRALMLEGGEIIAIGDPEEVSDRYIWSNMEQERKTEPKSPEEVEGQGIIKTVSLLNKNDVKIHDFVSGNPLKIAIKYDALKEPGDINFGVGLHLDTGGYVFGYNTQMDGFKLNGKSGSLVLNFEKMPLLTGTYRLNVICFGADEAAPLDFRPKVLQFNVSVLGTASGYHGLVDIEHDWQQ